MEEVEAIIKQRKRMEEVTGGTAGSLEAAVSRTAVSLYSNRAL